MTAARKCPKCGAAITETAGGLCPACLMKQAMATAATIESADIQTTSPEIGTKVWYFGDYELLQEIARGGMGVIYKARQASLNRTVALKMILSGQLANEAEVKRFHAEAEAAANLQHPNIVAIHEVGKHDGRHYFTMDFVEGQNLAQVIGGQPVPAQSAAQYAKTIAETIHFAHQRGTLHRDLKPQNVMIDADDHVRITDFGLAKRLHGNNDLTRTGAVMGSPNYMAPEQAQGRQDLVGPHTDVYAVGTILYELLRVAHRFLPRRQSRRWLRWSIRTRSRLPN
jgi:eukaryotic-like serine/threonine-protein kinase